MAKLYNIEIKLADDKQIYVTGDRVSGTVDLVLPKELPLANVAVSFRCLGEVKWVEHSGSPYFLDGAVYHDRHYYMKEFLDFGKPAVIAETMHEDHKTVSIPFTFFIPTDKNLPSSMHSEHGFIKYFVGVVIKALNPADGIIKTSREFVVQAPMTTNLMITVGGSAERAIPLHNGTVTMYASIDRKGFARGETIEVHVFVNNATTAKVCPRVSLHQIQIFMCGTRHKTIDLTVTGEDDTSAVTEIRGQEIEPQSKGEQTLKVYIPDRDALSIKSSLITVKYFLHVTLDIPFSADLKIDLPVVLTKQSAIGV